MTIEFNPNYANRKSVINSEEHSDCKYISMFPHRSGLMVSAADIDDEEDAEVVSVASAPQRCYALDGAVHVLSLAEESAPQALIRKCVSMMGTRCTMPMERVVSSFGTLGSWNFIVVVRGDEVVDFRVFDPWREIIADSVAKDSDHPGHTFWWNGICGSESEMRMAGFTAGEMLAVQDMDEAQSRRNLVDNVCVNARQLEVMESMCE